MTINLAYKPNRVDKNNNDNNDDDDIDLQNGVQDCDYSEVDDYQRNVNSNSATTIGATRTTINGLYSVPPVPLTIQGQTSSVPHFQPPQSTYLEPVSCTDHQRISKENGALASNIDNNMQPAAGVEVSRNVLPPLPPSTTAVGQPEPDYAAPNEFDDYDSPNSVSLATYGVVTTANKRGSPQCASMVQEHYGAVTSTPSTCNNNTEVTTTELYNVAQKPRVFLQSVSASMLSTDQSKYDTPTVVATAQVQYEEVDDNDNALYCVPRSALSNVDDAPMTHTDSNPQRLAKYLSPEYEAVDDGSGRGHTIVDDSDYAVVSRNERTKHSNSTDVES